MAGCLRGTGPAREGAATTDVPRAEEVDMPYATGSGVRIHYEVEGSGPPLVLHAGFVGTLADWHDFGYVDALKKENTLVLLDPRGQGESDKPHEAAAYTADQRVADVLAV